MNASSRWVLLYIQRKQLTQLGYMDSMENLDALTAEYLMFVGQEFYSCQLAEIENKRGPNGG